MVGRRGGDHNLDYLFNWHFFNDFDHLLDFYRNFFNNIDFDYLLNRHLFNDFDHPLNRNFFDNLDIDYLFNLHNLRLCGGALPQARVDASVATNAATIRNKALRFIVHSCFLLSNLGVSGKSGAFDSRRLPPIYVE